VYGLPLTPNPVYCVKPAPHCWLAVVDTAASTGMSARRYASAKCGVAQSTTVTVTSAGSSDGGAARQSPALRSIHFSVRAAVVGTGVAGEETVVGTEVGTEVVDDAAVFDGVALQPARHAVATTAMVIPASAWVRGIPIVGNFIAVRMARVYDDPDPDDGTRVLVDRLWPRGIHQQDPRVGRWCKQVAPSTELRRWYDHDPDRYAEFASRYRAELADPAVLSALDELRALAAEGPLTLVTATKQIEQSHLSVLEAVLEHS